MAMLCAAERWLFPLGFGGRCEAKALAWWLKALAWWLKLLSQGFAPRLRAWELCRSSAASAGARRGRRGGTRVPAAGMPRGHPGGWPVPARAPAPPQPARGQWGKTAWPTHRLCRPGGEGQRLDPVLCPSTGSGKLRSSHKEKPLCPVNASLGSCGQICCPTPARVLGMSPADTQSPSGTKCWVRSWGDQLSP